MQEVINVRGFDEETIGFEENTLCCKLEEAGLDINNSRISSFILHNEEDFNLKKWLYKKILFQHYEVIPQKIQTLCKKTEYFIQN